eukprot:2865061-Pyramimonas_sp.AAC.1
MRKHGGELPLDSESTKSFKSVSKSAISCKRILVGEVPLGPIGPHPPPVRDTEPPKSTLDAGIMSKLMTKAWLKTPSPKNSVTIVPVVEEAAEPTEVEDKASKDDRRVQALKNVKSVVNSLTAATAMKKAAKGKPPPGSTKRSKELLDQRFKLLHEKKRLEGELSKRRHVIFKVKADSSNRLSSFKKNLDTDPTSIIMKGDIYEVELKLHAIRVLQRALMTDEKLHGDEHLAVASASNELAAAYMSMERYDDALPYFQRSLAIIEKVHGKEHALVAVSLTGQAKCFCRKERYSDAQPLFKRALEIREKVLGKDDPRTVSARDLLESLPSTNEDSTATIPFGL